MRVAIARGGGQCKQRRRRRDEACRQRQLRAQPMHFVEIMLESDGGLRANRVRQRIRPHVRVAVAIASDPRAHAHERRHPIAREAEARGHLALEARIQPRQLGEQRIAVVREPVVDLVLHRETGKAQHRRLPQLEHRRRQAGREFGALGGREWRPVAPREQARDLALRIENALALNFGRVRGQNGAHARIVEPAREHRGVYAGGRDAAERVGDVAAARRRSRHRVRAPAAVAMHVLGDVRQMREIAERPDHLQRLADRQRVQQRGKRVAQPVGLGAARAAKADRRLADRHDRVESTRPERRAQHVAEHAAKEPRVLPERQILVDDVGSVHRGFNLRMRRCWRC